MVEEYCMDRFPDLHDSTETKGQVRDSSTDLHIWTLLLDSLGSLDEINTIVVVFLKPCTNSQHIGIKDDILRRETNLVHKDVIGPLTDADLLLFCGSLALLIKGHYHNSCTMLAQQSGLLNKELLSYLQGDRVHNTLALAPLQPSHDNLKLGCIQHKRNLGHLWVSDGNLDKLLHSSQTIQKTIIHIDINHMGTILHLLLGNIHGRFIVTSHHQLLELDGTSNIAPLSNIQEWHAKVVVLVFNLHVLQTRQPHLGSANIRKGPGLVVLGHLANSLDMGRGGSTASSYHVQPSILKEDLVLPGHVLWGVIITTHGIGQASIGVHMDKALCCLGQSLNEGGHVLGSQGTVQTNTHGLGMANRGIESLSSLARKGSTRLVHKCPRNKHRNVQATEFEKLPNSIQGCLGIQGVKNGLHHEDVTSSIHQTNNLLKVGLHQLIKGHIAGRGVFHRGRNGGCSVSGTKSTHHKSGLGGILGCDLITHFTGQPGTLIVQLIGIGLHLIISHGNGSGREGVGTNQVGSTFLQVLSVDSRDDLGLGDTEHVIVSLDIAVPVLESFSTVFLFIQLVALGIVLDHSTHGTIIDGNLGCEELSNILTQAISTTNIMREGRWIGIG